MGNLKFPRPKDINFPPVENPLKINMKEVAQRDDRKHIIARNIITLKSGNILINFVNVEEDNYGNCLEIYSVPKLEVVEKYRYECENNGNIFLSDYAIQLKNGDILTICDKIYIFDGESISNGPKISSEEINNLFFGSRGLEYFYESFLTQNNLNIKYFPIHNLCEAKEGTLLYNSDPRALSLFDLKKLYPEEKEIFIYQKGTGLKTRHPDLDIIHFSEYYPENVYICANDHNSNNKNSDLLIFNINELCENNTEPLLKKPLHIIKVSGSQEVFGLCEYDKKYLLLDTINNGVYIIDMESKKKVAVSALRLFIKELNTYQAAVNSPESITNGRFTNLYRKIIKLKDGQVILLINHWAYVADIREQKMIYGANSLPLFTVSGNYILFMNPQTGMRLHKIYEE